MRGIHPLRAERRLRVDGMDRGISWILIGAGLAAIVLGVAINYGLFGWFGKLPGDMRIENESSRIYIPITSMLLISVVVTVVINIARRL